MTAAERGSLGIGRLRAAFRDGTETPEGVAATVLERIARAGDDGVWISRRDGDDLLRDARSLAARPDRGSLPLYGIPFAVKDNIDVAGLPTTAGCPAFAYRPARSATVVERLVAAGALVVGKTNLDQFAAGLVGTRSPYGVPRNPFDPAMPPGGSSSGSAVAVAAGLVSFALGTDTAGSGRVPASFNDLVGLKPTRGLLSAAGVVPACRSLDCVSVFAATVDDAVAVAEAAAGFDGNDPFSRSAPPGFGFRAGGPGGSFRFGVPFRAQREFFGDSEAEALYEAALLRAAEAGGIPVEIDFSPWRDAAALLYGPFTAERAAEVEDLLRSRPEALHPVTRAVLAPGLAVGGMDVVRAQHRLRGLAQAAARAWRQVDVLLLPTTGTAFTLAQIAQDPVARNTDLGFYTNGVNLLDQAALAIPNGFTARGFPAGVTLVAPAWHDGVLAAIARRLLGDPGTAHGDGRTAYPHLEVAVFGAHLSGQPLNPALLALGGVLRRPCRTAAAYRMKLLPGAVERPALVQAAPGTGVSVEGEVWAVPAASVGAFLAGIAPPLGLGTVQMDDGTAPTGFIADGGVPADAADISGFGGWRAYRAAAAPG